ncbi:MAG: HNH endonuclease [Anaerolineales bacterium]|nr:HNH endonuclease [Anaerolineales bacterium]
MGVFGIAGKVANPSTLARGCEVNWGGKVVRNPNWTRDELILALDLYFQPERGWKTPDDERVIELSKALNRLSIHERSLRGVGFRNPQGVSMKLGNFLRFDPEYQGTGLERGSKLDETVWNEFANDPDMLNCTATAIIDGQEQLPNVESAAESIDEEEEFSEGKILTRLHKGRERNRSAVKRKKERVLEETDRLACEVCDFDFFERFGELGKGIADCHHTVPISDLSQIRITRLDDLAIVCPNCHRIIHSSKPMLTIPELQSLLEHRNQSA